MGPGQFAATKAKQVVKESGPLRAYFPLVPESPLALQLDRQQSLHFVGVGGIGMSALAGILAERGFVVSGSDRRDTPVLANVRPVGKTHLMEDFYYAGGLRALMSVLAPKPIHRGHVQLKRAIQK